jgi:hypothetical protein
VYSAGKNSDVLNFRRQWPNVVDARLVNEFGCLLEADLGFAAAKAVGTVQEMASTYGCPS